MAEQAPKPKRRGGKPSHEPTEETRRQVELLAAIGTQHAMIAKVLGISGNTLTKHYRPILDMAAVQANAAVAQSLWKMATGTKGDDGKMVEKPNVIAAIFWMKTRGGWKEKNSMELMGPDGQPLAPPSVFVGFAPDPRGEGHVPLEVDTGSDEPETDGSEDDDE